MSFVGEETSGPILVQELSRLSFCVSSNYSARTRSRHLGGPVQHRFGRVARLHYLLLNPPSFGQEYLFESIVGLAEMPQKLLQPFAKQGVGVQGYLLPYLYHPPELCGIFWTAPDRLVAACC